MTKLIKWMFLLPLIGFNSAVAGDRNMNYFMEGQFISPNEISLKFESAMSNRYSVKISRLSNTYHIEILCNGIEFINSNVSNEFAQITGAEMEVNDNRNCDVKYVSIYMYSHSRERGISANTWEFQFDGKKLLTINPPLVPQK
jgi:hypothetical protein